MSVRNAFIQLRHCHQLILKLKSIHQIKSTYCTNINNVAKPLFKLKGKSYKHQVKPLVDLKIVETKGGDGGDGCISLLSISGNEDAGPDGGNGGHGGHVIFQASSNVRDLFEMKTVLKAENGVRGGNKNCDGKNAPHTIIKVPLGTIVKREFDEKIVGDLTEEGCMFVAARGGAGGHGNAHFRSDTNQTPEVAEYGGKGEHIRYIVELKSIADFGLIGMPNAGKSTLLQAITRARPKVASYPFTTLAPYLGIIHYDDHEQISVADLPGLIEDSHKNKGLGIRFLKHAERCAALLIMIDTSQQSPWEQVEVLREELYQFSEDLMKRKQIIIANKIDLPNAKENVEKLKEHFRNDEVIAISAKHSINLLDLLIKMRLLYDKHLVESKTPDQLVESKIPGR